MTSRLLALSALTLAALALQAQTKFATLKAGRTTYTNVSVLGSSTTDLYFTHAHGIANVKLRLLSPALQEQFHYDASAAAAAERQQIENDARYTEILARTIETQAQRPVVSPTTPRTWEDLALADPLGETSAINRAAPEITVEKWLGETPDAKGKLTLVLFWASTSNASRAVLPLLNGWQKTHADKLLIVGVSSETEAALSDAAEPKPEFVSGSDPKSKLARALAVTTLPCAVLIDPQGIVRYQGHPSALDETKLQAVFDQAAQ
jgi:thiol-disulfide isomerase/thioredoxin